MSRAWVAYDSSNVGAGRHGDTSTAHGSDSAVRPTVSDGAVAVWVGGRTERGRVAVGGRRGRIAE